MAAATHELAPHHLPSFIPSADGGDPLMTIMLAVLLIGVVLLGTFYLHLHSLPERLAHKHGRMQFELVAVLGLLALFTHNNLFWVAALLLAFVQLPDFMTPLGSIANSLSRMANPADMRHDSEPEPPREATEPDAPAEPDTIAAASEPTPAPRQAADRQEG
jgi:hypothetical protein